MPIFEYLTFVCDQTELQGLLTEAGLERWRLHTCDPVTIIGPHGSGVLQAFVVMDRLIEGEPTQEQADFDNATEGLAMVG